MALGFPHFSGQTEQRRSIVLRKRYWLYYGLTFLSGARRQIFMVFAAFLMVGEVRLQRRPGDPAVSHQLRLQLAVCLSWIGHLIAKIGERAALTIECVGLIAVFTAYAFVENATVAAGLYIIDHMFFALYIAMSTYFHKIADPADLASSAGVSLHHQPHCRGGGPRSLGLGPGWFPTRPCSWWALASPWPPWRWPATWPDDPAPGNEVILGRAFGTPKPA